MDIDFVLGNDRKILIELESCCVVLGDHKHDEDVKLCPISLDDKKIITDRVINEIGDNYEVVNVNALYNGNRELVKLVFAVVDKEDAIHRLSVRGISLFDLLNE